MYRFRQYFRTAFRLLILILLGCWTVAQHFIKHILALTIKKEEVKETQYTSIIENNSTPVLSPPAQPETITSEPQVLPEQTEPVLVENNSAPVLLPAVQSEITTIEPEKDTLAPAIRPETTTTESENDPLVSAAIEAYCVKCRQKRTIQNAKKVTTPKGRRAVEGKCSVCGTKLFRFIARGKENLSE